MKFFELALPGVFLIEPELIEDERGSFRRSFCASEFKSNGLEARVFQGNFSENYSAGTLRGFHYQLPPYQEAKTLTCVSGAIFDIVLDLRPKSPTFLKHIDVELSAHSRSSLHLPPGCANAWLTLEENTTLHYYMSEKYTPSADAGIRFNDPHFNFKWPREPVVMSKKDLKYPNFHLQDFLNLNK